MLYILATTSLFLFLACLDSWADVADEPKRTMPHQIECAIPLPTEFWSESIAKPFEKAEAWAWNKRICLGKKADMRYAPGGNGAVEKCQPAVIEKKGVTVPAYRKLRPEFLELILSHEPWASAPRHSRVDIRCALVRGKLYLESHEIVSAFIFEKGKIDGQVDLSGTKLRRGLSLQGSVVSGKLTAQRMEVGGPVALRSGGMFKDIDLLGAKITGNVSLDGSTVAGKLTAERMEVGGNLTLHDGGMFKDIDLLGAKIAGNVSLDGSTVTGMLGAEEVQVGSNLSLRDGGRFKDIRLLDARITNNAVLSSSIITGKLTAQRMEVGGNLMLHDGGIFKDIDLLGAKIVDSVSLKRSTVTGKLNAEDLEVGGNLFLYNGTFRDIVLVSAEIGRSIYLGGSTFSGAFNLTGATLGRELHLFSGWLQRHPTWQNGASLILRNVKADALQAQGDSWQMSEGDELLPTDLTGFTFNRLGGLDTQGGTSMGDESVSWLIRWIKTQRDYGNSYDPQPYTQLAQVLESAGATAKAKAIRYAKFEHKREYDKSLNFFRRVLLTMERIFIGYGVYPFWILGWFVGLVVVGGLLAQYSQQQSVRRWMGLWYSLENALPLIETNERFKNVEHGRPWLVHYFHFHKAFGFVLATVLVGALTLLSG